MDWIHTDNWVQEIESVFASASGQIYRSVIGETEKILIEKALQRCHGNQILAAKLLGINRNTLRAKIKKFNIPTGKFKHE